MNLEHFLKDAFEQKVPFSFVYGGEPVCAEDFSAPVYTADGKYCERSMQTGDGNLTATLKMRKYEAAVEWWLELTGCGDFDSEIISSLKYADLTIVADEPYRSEEMPRIIWSHGSLAQPDDFMPEYMPFTPDTIHDFQCRGGRSSDGCMPYFNLQLNKHEGVMLAIGWSGQWKARFQRLHHADRPIRFTAEMDNAYFRVLAGETLELPHMVALVWNSPVMESFNIWRRFMRWQILPKYDGKPLEACIGLRAWGGLPPEIHQSKFENVRKHNLSAEIYQIDAGWHGEGYEKSDNYYFDNWYLTIGTWKPLPALYPEGMSAFGDACRSAGMDLAIWFEPERMLSWNKNVKLHPDYFIGPRLPKTTKGSADAAVISSHDMMVNLGNPEAREWIANQISAVLEDAKAAIFRIDFNYRPLPYWKYADQPDRKGVTEIKYVNGLYAMLSSLLKRHPKLRIDNCASGGRRLDYRMFRYSIPMFCRSDYFCFKDHRPAPKQSHTYGLSLWTPAHADSLGSCIGHTKEVMDTYRFRSTLTAGIGMTAPWWDLSEDEAIWYRKMLEDAKRVRPYMQEDFYPLTGYSLSELDWMAWQMHAPERESGMIMAFRREKSQVREYEFELKGIDENAEYQLEDIDLGDLGTVAGKHLVEGFKVQIPEKRATRILFYTKLPTVSTSSS